MDSNKLTDAFKYVENALAQYRWRFWKEDRAKFSLWCVKQVLLQDNEWNRNMARESVYMAWELAESLRGKPKYAVESVVELAKAASKSGEIANRCLERAMYYAKLSTGS